MKIGNAKLTAAEVPAMRRRLNAGESTVMAEADRFMCAPETIRRAWRGETFRHLAAGAETTQSALPDVGEELSIERVSALVEIARAAGALREAPPSPLDGGDAPDEGDAHAHAILERAALLRSISADAIVAEATGPGPAATEAPPEDPPT